uniref:Uncharacterized protein n=1 Tax=Zea mays TaxID=4577 RepID=B8A074_MAIZE|nr:unknown [Zea mays]
MMKLRGSALKRSPSRSALMPKTFLCQVDYWTLQWDLSMILICEFVVPLLKSCFWTWHLRYGPEYLRSVYKEVTLYFLMF